MKGTSEKLEFQKSMTQSYLKTVSAFANSNDGQIIFVIDEYGTIVGIQDPERHCRMIEKAIHDHLQPVPDYDLDFTNSNTIILSVYKGDDTPYFYNGIAYIRHESSSIPVNSLELKRLSLAGLHQNFEDLPAKSQDLSFHDLEGRLYKSLKIEHLSDDVFKTLGFLKETHYTIVAELFAYENRFPGVDLISFGDSIVIILMRKTFSHHSLLKVIDETLTIFRDHYTYEVVIGLTHQTIEMIPEEAFREALIHALIWREWDLPSSVQIAMYHDRLEIIIPGGLPEGISDDHSTSHEHLVSKLV